MENKIRLLGVHPVAAEQPCHMIEIQLAAGVINEFDWMEVTQAVDELPQGNWQVAYDEQVVEETNEQTRYVFFFHYLDLKKPLRTSLGEISLPDETPPPQHLQGITYFPVD
ncbi:MAG: hypothetical protein OEZ02_09800 [Anaerolineae bacterium]|nr:hypothetical protein [Anaerolineae bacterium]